MATMWIRSVVVCLLCGLLRGSILTEQSVMDSGEDLGVDMCPECKPFVAPIITTACNLHEEDLGADMCPEKGQPLASTVNNRVYSSAKDAVGLVKELQQLVKVQQSQVDRLAYLLQKLGKTREMVEVATMDQEVFGLSKEDLVRRKDSNVRTTDEDVLEWQSLEDSPFTGLIQTQEQELVGTKVDKASAATPADISQLPEDAEGPGSGLGGMTVARYRPAWSEHFSFLSAVKVDGEVSCLHVLPQEGEGGLSRYVVIGDMTGRLYIFTWLGDLLLDYPTISRAPIMSMLSYTLPKDETILVTGHADGGVLVHQIWETEDASVSGDGGTTLSSIEILHSLIPPSPCMLRSNDEDRKSVDLGIDLSTQYICNAEFENEENTPLSSNVQSITNLEMYKVGKIRYTLVGDVSGKLQLFRDNGSLYGFAMSPSRPLAFMRSPSAQRLVFLTEEGVGSLDLRSMLVRSSRCEGLNTSAVTAYAFDVAGRSKANGFTSDGDLVYVALTGDILHFECHVKKKRKLELPGPFAPQALKGYLLAASPNHVLVFNTTLHLGFSYANYWVGGPRPLFSVTMTEIALSFLKRPITHSRWPVVASNRDRLVVIGFGEGYVGLFRSNLPVTKPADLSAKFWNSPMLIFVLILLGIWQFFIRRRELGTAGSPEYSLGVPSVTPAFRKVESTRLGFGERKQVTEPRRFKSPTRGYVAGGSRTFRSSATDANAYSRREPLFASTQPVGEQRQVD